MQNAIGGYSPASAHDEGLASDCSYYIRARRVQTPPCPIRQLHERYDVHCNSTDAGKLICRAESAVPRKKAVYDPRPPLQERAPYLPSRTLVWNIRYTILPQNIELDLVHLRRFRPWATRGRWPHTCDEIFVCLK